MHESVRSDIYLFEFAELCSRFADVSNSWDDFVAVAGDYDFVHLHWPESYFAGVKPSDDELNKFNEILSEWKKKSIVVITRHNFLPHTDTSETYVKLYHIFYSNAHIVHHLGQFSKMEFEERYKGEQFLGTLKHCIIPHHYFYSYPSTATREEARAFLGIPKDKLVMLVFGSIRKRQEKKLIGHAFRSIKAKNKLLLIPRWHNVQPSTFDSIKENLDVFGTGYLKELWQKQYMLQA
ncbi:MAG: hypothetical protein EOP53_19585, partial [Sphingobacteriales bacterium]